MQVFTTVLVLLSAFATAEQVQKVRNVRFTAPGLHMTPTVPQTGIPVSRAPVSKTTVTKTPAGQLQTTKTTVTVNRKYQLLRDAALVGGGIIIGANLHALWFSDAFKKYREWVEIKWQKFTDSLRSFGETLKSYFKAIIGFVAEFPAYVRAALVWIWECLVAFKNSIESLGTRFKRAVGLKVTEAKEAAKDIKDSADAAVAAGLEKAQEAATATRETVEIVASAVVEKKDALAARGEEAIQNTNAAFAGAVKNAAEAVGSQADQVAAQAAVAERDSKVAAVDAKITSNIESEKADHDIKKLE